MSCKLQLFVCIFFCFYEGYALAQTDSTIESIAPEAETLMEQEAEDNKEVFDYAEVQENLNYYRQHPLDLNTLTKDQLSDFYFLTPFQINEFFRYRERNGRFADPLELQTLKSFDTVTVHRLLPYIIVNDPQILDIHSYKGSVTNEVVMTYGKLLQKQQGYIIPDTANQNRYEGSPDHMFMRYRIHWADRFMISLNMEKDPGEPFSFTGHNIGFDFYSACISYKGTASIRKLVIGDYSLQFGQGLALWAGMNFNKGAGIASVARQGVGLKPYTSANECLFFRGAAAAFALGKITFTPFFSIKKEDASLSVRDTLDSTRGVTSLNQTGLHRTKTEIANHDDIFETLYGGNAEYSSGNLRAGANVSYLLFSRDFLPGRYLYDKFYFKGRTIADASFYGSYNWQNLYFFSEIARSQPGGCAFIAGILASLTKQVSVILTYRQYEKEYYSFFNQGLSEGTNGTAEKGFYSGIEVEPVSGVHLTVLTDVFQFPWLRYNADAPSSGFELFSQLRYSPYKNFELSFRYKVKGSEENDDQDETVHFLQQVYKQSFRIETVYRINFLQLRNRAELSLYSKDEKGERGFLIAQDVICKPSFSKFRCSFRLALFNTDSYNSRIYSYENDLLYSYSIPGYQDKGIRFYINIGYRPERSLDLSARYAITSYYNTESIGSGLDAIEGHNRSEVKVQLRYAF